MNISQLNTPLHKQFLKNIEKSEFIPMFTSAGPGDAIILSGLPEIIYNHFNKKVNIYRKTTVPDDRGGYINSWRDGKADDEYVRLNGRTLPIFDNNPYVNEQIYLRDVEWDNVRKKILYTPPLLFSFMHGNVLENMASLYGINVPIQNHTGIYFSDEEIKRIKRIKNTYDKPIILFRQGPERHITSNKYYHLEFWEKLFGKLKEKFYLMEVGPNNVTYLEFCDRWYKFCSIRSMFCLVKASFCMISPESGLSSIPKAVGAERFIRLWYEDSSLDLSKELKWYGDSEYKSILISPEKAIPETIENTICEYLMSEI